jgi:hypothetical protein
MGFYDNFDASNLAVASGWQPIYAALCSNRVFSDAIPEQPAILCKLIGSLVRALVDQLLPRGFCISP